MAERLCFFIDKNNDVIEKYVEFEYIKGMAFSQKVKCANSLRKAIAKKYPSCNPIEVSSKSSTDLGRSLSAFSLTLNGNYVESVFQSSKVFSISGQFEFLKHYKPADAKKYIKENGNGELVCFKLNGVKYPLNPKSAFYDWIYINALDKLNLGEGLLKFDVFTDIEFNDKKSINCQARAVAIYVSMLLKNKKNYYLSNFDIFKTFYKKNSDRQMLLFE